MNDLELWNKLYALIEDVGFDTRPEKDQNLTTFGFDDLDGVEFLMNVEEEFEIEIPEEDAMDLTTLQSYFDYLRKRGF